jgi:hypothetical protein
MCYIAAPHETLHHGQQATLGGTFWGIFKAYFLNGLTMRVWAISPARVQPTFSRVLK